ncbi:threonine aldolase family protein [Neomicrococcus lactis]|uniref:threonine aldolase family protein n=1 Tax=Neomicrococcus lactis TaxID=732241 RepID=UPI00161497C7|nr:low specificity L-threonine aldolase [Neomicrococcus lactis]
MTGNMTHSETVIESVLHDVNYRSFASDNYSGVHPQILEALSRANGGHVSAYGADPYTHRFEEIIKGHFGEQAEVFTVFNGTGANVTALQAMLPRWGAVICTTNSHIHVDEGGAPEKVGGFKLLPIETPDGKLTPEFIDKEAWGWGDEHRSQPLVVELTQSTEVGTLYTPDEIKAITDHAHSKGMKVYADGARLSNAAAALGLGFKEFTTDVGLDAISLGGTKNGLMFGESIVVLTPDAAPGLAYGRKFNMQLASKLRFASAQLIEMFGTDLWLRNAQQANAMAQKLSNAVVQLDGIELTQKTEANAVFAKINPAVADKVRENYAFYDWDLQNEEVRWMCSFDTTEEDINGFVECLKSALGGAPRS